MRIWTLATNLWAHIAVCPESILPHGYSHTKCGWKLHLSHGQGAGCEYSHAQNVGRNCKLYTSCETTIASSCLILATNHLHVYTKSVAFFPGSTLVEVSKNRKGRLGDFVVQWCHINLEGRVPTIKLCIHQLQLPLCAPVSAKCTKQEMLQCWHCLETFQPLVHGQDATKIGFEVHYSTLRPVCLPNITWYSMDKTHVLVASIIWPWLSYKLSPLWLIPVQHRTSSHRQHSKYLSTSTVLLCCCVGTW